MRTGIFDRRERALPACLAAIVATSPTAATWSLVNRGVVDLSLLIGLEQVAQIEDRYDATVSQDRHA